MKHIVAIDGGRTKNVRVLVSEYGEVKGIEYGGGSVY
jgi:hypothetical protein